MSSGIRAPDRRSGRAGGKRGWLSTHRPGPRGVSKKANPANRAANRTRPPAPPAIRPRRMPPPGSGKAAKPRAAATEAAEDDAVDEAVDGPRSPGPPPCATFPGVPTSHERTKGLMPKGIRKLAKYPAMMAPNKRHVPMALSLSRIWRHFQARTNCSAAMARGTRSTNPMSAWVMTCRRRWKSMRQRTQEIRHNTDHGARRGPPVAAWFFLGRGWSCHPPVNGFSSYPRRASANPSPAPIIRPPLIRLPIRAPRLDQK